jgi:hypothetical protein
MTIEQMGSFVPETNLNNLYGLVIPAQGHDFYDAINDLVDNCFDARANNIYVNIIEDDDKNIIAYQVIDDGSGMGLQTLKKSMTYSAGSIHSTGDMGKFSIGGTTACCTIGLTREVFTKTKSGELFVGEQDFTNVIGGTSVRMSENDEFEYFESLCGKSGTIITISDLRDDKRVAKRAGDLKNTLLKKLGMTYYRLLSNGKTNLYVILRGKKYQVNARDPLFGKTEPEKVVRDEEKIISFNGSKIYLRFVELNLDLISQSEKGYDQQGVYVCRNDRVIVTGVSIPNFWVKNPRKNHGRMEIRFDERLDDHFGLTSIKNKINMSQSLRDSLLEDVKIFVAELEQKWAKNSQTDDSLRKEEQDYTTSLGNKAHEFFPKKKVPQSRTPRGKKGTNPRGSGGGAKRPSKAVILPLIVHETHPRVPEPFWVEVKEGEMSIVFNDGHPMIKDKYHGGTKAEKDMFRLFATSICLGQWDYMHTNDRCTVERFMTTTLSHLGKLYQAMS